MLELTQQRSKIVMVSHNAEMHGKEPVPVTYITIQTVVSNDVLSFFDGKMKGAFYKKDPEQKQEEMLQGNLPLLKFPKIGPIKYDYIGLGYKFILHYGIDGKSDIQLEDCKVDNIILTLQDGGSVVMKLKITAHPDELKRGKLDGLIKQLFDITLVPPEEDQQQQNAA